MGAPDTQAFALPWTAGKDQIAALRSALRKGLSPLTVEPPIKPADWAKKYFYLSAEASHGQQRWNPYAYQGPILNVFGNEDIEQIAFIKSARVGYTKMLDIKGAWTAEHKRRNQAIWQPTDEDRDSYVKTEIDPMIRDVEVLRKIAASPTGKSKTNTLNQKQFVGSILHLLGAKSAKNFRRITISDAHIDELDGCDREV
ncbi:MAG TPA: phage terminase large subunit family protein, partial [Kofleriaceae bacterium]|nr:phage terminase large subunit family protein [Kofleriaceae bacterium]